MQKILTTLLFIPLTVTLQAEPADPLAASQPTTWKSPNGGTLNVRVRTPDKFEPGKSYPVLLFLHGAGGRGGDNAGQLNDAGAGKALEKIGVANKFNAYILAGQVPKQQQWVDVPWSSLDHEMPAVSDPMRLMLEQLDAFIADPKNQIDKNRIYVAGLSMGGYGTWDAIQRRPDLFAAAVPICGGGDKRLAKKFAHIPVWAWHGDKDNVIKASRSLDMVDALKKAGANPKYTEVAGRGHNVWTDAFNSPDLWAWLFAQKKN
ncbi:MAG: prolyl oligopeptidase family serine peptidase [Verrucomicrobiales bacterium]|nr:prolyl oligopeptidase family serine peptidase [Verrucomicrobiales bacterium]